MNTNDQWFNPGDKVARVARQPRPGATISMNPDAEFGQVYCVENCWFSPNGFNVISLVGFPPEFHPDGRRRGWVARNFRRVDEIRLCAAAAKHIKQREEELV